MNEFDEIDFKELERMKVHAMLKAELERLKKLKKEKERINAEFDTYTFREKVEYLDREHVDQIEHHRGFF